MADDFDAPKAASEIAARYGLTLEQVRSRHRYSEYVNARAAICAMLRQNGWMFAAIGRFLNRDHTTCMAMIGQTKASVRNS